MKKVALSLMALALVGASAFAADSTAGTTIPAPLTASLSANGWAQVGTDLDNATWGFKNGTEAKITLTILNGSNSKGDQGGTISVADIKIFLDGATSGAALALSIGDVTAKLVAGDLYVKLTKWGSPSVDYSKDIDNDSGASAVTSDDTYYTLAGQYGGTTTEFGFANVGSVDPLASGAGVEVGYTLPSLLALVFNLDSQTSGWAIKNNAEIKAEASLLAVEKLTLKAGFGLSTVEKSIKGLGLTAAYDLGMVAPFATYNLAIPASGDSTSVVELGAKAPVAEGIKVAGAAILDGASTAGKTLTGATVSFEGFSAVVGAELRDLGAVVRSTNSIYAKYTLGLGDGLSAWARTNYQTVSSADAALFIQARLEASKVLPMTVFAVEYDSNDYLSKATGAKPIGQLFAEAKVSY